MRQNHFVLAFLMGCMILVASQTVHAQNSDCDPPKNPTVVPGNPTTTAIFSWSQGTGATPKEYEVRKRTDDMGSALIVGYTTGKSYNITGLTSGVRYEFLVYACDSLGRRSSSSMPVFYIPATFPSVSVGGLTMTQTNPIANNVAPVRFDMAGAINAPKRTIYRSTDNGATWAEIWSGFGTPVQASNGGTITHYTVTLNCNAGTSLYSFTTTYLGQETPKSTPLLHTVR
jgi:hypothetical protein